VTGMKGENVTKDDLAADNILASLLSGSGLFHDPQLRSASGAGWRLSGLLRTVGTNGVLCLCILD